LILESHLPERRPVYSSLMLHWRQVAKPFKVRSTWLRLAILGKSQF
jgi:hypothetical protein